MHAGEGLRRTVARVVVQKPARAFLRAGLARALEVLSLQRERESMAGGKRERRGSSFRCETRSQPCETGALGSTADRNVISFPLGSKARSVAKMSMSSVL